MPEIKTLRSVEVPRLVVKLPDGKEVHHPIVGREITIGRDSANHIVIVDHFVSKFHAKLLSSEHGLTLVDLESPNKTYVNGRPITQSALSYGDKIQFAGVRCELLGPETAEKKKEPAPPPSPQAVASPPAAARASRPAPPPAAARPAAPAPSAGKAKRAGPPPAIEADPMKRLLRIGGLLIGVSLALAVLLRILLVPSATPEETEEADTGALAPATAGRETTTSSPPAAPSGSTAQPSTSVPKGSSAQFFFDEALSYLDAGRLKDAQANFRRVLELEPSNPRAKTRLSLLEEEIERKAERHFDSAREAFRFLRYEEAIAEWEMFLTLVDSTDSRYVAAHQGIEQAGAKLR